MKSDQLAMLRKLDESIFEAFRISWSSEEPFRRIITIMTETQSAMAPGGLFPALIILIKSHFFEKSKSTPVRVSILADISPQYQKDEGRDIGTHIYMLRPYGNLNEFPEGASCPVCGDEFEFAKASCEPAPVGRQLLDRLSSIHEKVSTELVALTKGPAFLKVNSSIRSFLNQDGHQHFQYRLQFQMSLVTEATAPKMTAKVWLLSVDYDPKNTFRFETGPAEALIACRYCIGTGFVGWLSAGQNDVK